VRSKLFLRSFLPSREQFVTFSRPADRPSIDFSF
jgi:hypothetical protein